MPTNNPVPSRDPSDLPFNAEKLDQVVNSPALQYTDRKGVSRDTIAGAVAKIAAITNRGAWAPATVYVAKDIVLQGGTWYIAVVPHTSASTFAADVGTKWRVYQGVMVSEVPYALASLSALRGYSGDAAAVYVTGYLVMAEPSGVAGLFTRDGGDTTSADDGGMLIVDVLGRRWRRRFAGAVHLEWFGVVLGNDDANGPINKAAIDAAIAAMPSLTYGAAGLAGELVAPAGVIVTDAGHVIPDGKSMAFRGAGCYATLFKRATTAMGDFLTNNARNTEMHSFGYDGNRYNCLNAGDGIVCNKSYSEVRHVFLEKVRGTGLVVGKTAMCLGGKFTSIDIRDCLDYGVLVPAGLGSTDNIFTAMFIGQTGKSCFRTNTGAQTLVACHVWQGGLEHATDNHGYYLNSGSNNLVGCEGETNLGSGAYIVGVVTSGASSTRANRIQGGKYWGNVGPGIINRQAQWTKVAGVSVYQNCVGNTAQAADTAYSAILNDGGIDCDFSVSTIYDREATVPTPTYSVAPTYPFPGRATAIKTQAYAYSTINSGDYSSVTGNTMRAEQTCTGISIGASEDHDKFHGNNRGDEAVEARSISGNAIRVPAHAIEHTITFTNNSQIDNILGGYEGRKVSLICLSGNSDGFTTAGNIAVPYTFKPRLNQRVDFVYRNLKWYPDNVDLGGSASYNPPSLADGAGVTTIVGVTGAEIGDYVVASFSNDLQGVRMFGWVSASGTTSVRFENETGATVDLASGLIRVRALRA